MQIDGPKEEDFNKNKIGSNENFEFEMIALNNNGEEVTLKSRSEEHTSELQSP